jgi:hypothetical protein
MGLLTLVLRLPLLPVDGVIWLAETLRDEAERELYDPMAVRRELADAERAAEAGELSEDELAQVEEEVVGRLVGGPAAGAGPPGQPGQPGRPDQPRR